MKRIARLQMVGAGVGITCIASTVFSIVGKFITLPVSQFVLLTTVIILAVITVVIYGVVVVLMRRNRQSISVSLATSLIWVAVAIVNGVHIALL